MTSRRHAGTALALRGQYTADGPRRWVANDFNRVDVPGWRGCDRRVAGCSSGWSTRAGANTRLRGSDRDTTASCASTSAARSPLYGGAELEPVATGNGAGIAHRFESSASSRRVTLLRADRPAARCTTRNATLAQQQYEAISAYLAGQATQPFVNPPTLKLPTGAASADRVAERLLREGVQPEPARRLAEVADGDGG